MPDKAMATLNPGEMAAAGSRVPLVSFIIPCYNLPAELIRECVDSIMALTLGGDEREIIVVDDGSEVSPMDGLTGLEGEIVYIRQPNGGLSAARNTGLRAARGKYIQFVDGDDRLIQAPYEHCLDIVRYKSPDMVMFRSVSRCGAVYGSKLPLSGRGAVNLPFVCPQPVSGAEYMLSNNLRAAAWGYVFRCGILGDLWFDEALSSHEDEDFTPRLVLRAARLFATSADAYYYRLRPGSITGRNDLDHILRRLQNIERVVYKLASSAAAKLPDRDKKAMERRVAQLTMDYLYNVIHLTHDGELLRDAIGRLRGKGLFPLPGRPYTRKYACFRMMVNHGFTRGVLMKMIR